jgi:hypothetical protein
MTPNVLISIIETLKSYEVKLDSDLISEIVEILLNNGMTLDELEECYGFDDELDLVLDEYERAKDDSEEVTIDEDENL